MPNLITPPEITLEHQDGFYYLVPMINPVIQRLDSDTIIPYIIPHENISIWIYARYKVRKEDNVAEFIDFVDIDGGTIA